VFSACATDSATSSGEASSTPTQTCSNADQISNWEINRRLAQLLMGAVNTNNGDVVVDQAVQALAKDRLGGVNFLGNNFDSDVGDKLAEVVDAGGEVPPLLAVDEEGGDVQRLSAVVGDVPSAREMTQAMTPEQVQAEAKRIGKAMRKLSLNMDFAPVVDVGTRAIGDRTFSDNPEIVTEYAGSFAAGLREAGIIPTLKHFPGLGSATGNTDFQTATTPPLSELKKKDLFPYRHLLDEQPVAVMFANAEVPGLTNGKPASLSPAAYELLRDDLGFDGVAITDSLSAVAISAEDTVPEAAEKAIAAGADIALWDDVSQAVAVRKHLKKAVAKGRISEDRINQAVGRVIGLKGIDLCSGR
jgi:beta-N-acetylhexosaminidase